MPMRAMKSSNCCAGFGVGLMLQLGAIGEVVEPHRQVEHQSARKANSDPKLPGDAVVGK
jgi:hypothetical protein